MSLTAKSSLESASENFSSTRRKSCLERFFRHQLARIGEKKIFQELDVHLLEKVGIKCFWAQEAEMSLTAISLLESARRKFFINST